MRLFRHGNKGHERPGVLDDEGTMRDLSKELPDISGDILSASSLGRLRDIDFSNLPEIDFGTRIGPCVADIGKIVCVGLNYKDHAEEAGLEPPKEPILFMKATTAVSGPNDPIVLPRGSEKTDWEVELGVVIGEPTKYVDAANALDHVAGFCLVNDVSERSYQLERSGQWLKGKSADSFAPIGPWLVTKDDVADVQNLDLWLDVNGVRRQAGNTRNMIFPVSFLVSYISQFMSLQPGDIIATGTPAGVGMGFSPPIFLKDMDNIKLGVTGLGEQASRVVTE
ncbi:MAG: fumarylacetoacetate hydrolase family protein [Pseudomonadota bacterium]